MHPLMVLLAFAVAALVTYAVVLAALTAASAVPDEPCDDLAEDGSREDCVPATSSDAMLTTRSTDRPPSDHPRRSRASC